MPKKQPPKTDKQPVQLHIAKVWLVAARTDSGDAQYPTRHEEDFGARPAPANSAGVPARASTCLGPALGTVY